MRNTLLVLAALAVVGCGHAAVQGHPMAANGASGPAIGVAAAPQGSSTAVHKASNAPLSHGTLAAVNSYRGTTEPAERKPCMIQLTSEMQRAMNGTDSLGGRPHMRIKEISVPCSTRCPGERAYGSSTGQKGPRPGY